MSAATDPRTSQDLTGMPAFLLQAAVVIVILAGWQLMAMSGNLNAIISEPTQIIARLISMLAGEDAFGSTLYEHVWQTVQELVIGYIVGSVLGIACGVAFARSVALSRIFQPYLMSVYSIPKIALAPLFVLFFGIGIASKVAIVIAGVFFMLFFNTYAGILSTNPEFVNIARVMGANDRFIFRRVIWPSALPAVFTGFRLGVPFAMIGAMVGEYIAAFQGLGYFIVQASAHFDTSAMFAGIIVLIVVVWSGGQLVAFTESRLLQWQPKRQREAEISA